MAPKKSKDPAFAAKDMVLAKMTGFPAWPSFVMPPDMIPSAIMKAKKKSTNTCVIFIPDGDFNWMNEKSLEALSAEKLRARISKIPKDKLKPRNKNKTTRTNNVADAFVAAEGLDFDEFMAELAESKGMPEDEDEESDNENDHEIANDNELEAEEEEEEEGEETLNGKDDPIEESDTDPARPRSSRRTRLENGKALLNGTKDDSDNDGTNASDEKDSNQEDDEIEDEGNEDGSADEDSKDAEDAESNGQRKRLRSSGSKTVPVAKRPKLEPAAPSKTMPIIKADKVTKASSPKVMDEKDRQHQLWLCRIKLQRSLIQRNQPVTPEDPKDYPPPTVDELLVARIILHRLADFPVNIQLLRDTKIHKVLKCILKDPDLEYPDSFRLHEKCEELLKKWQDMIESLKSEKQGKAQKSEASD